MSSPRGQRIQAHCVIIWGNGAYDLDLETDDWQTFWAIVKKDFGTYFGPPLTITGICRSENHAWRELDRMLAAWARVIRSGELMTEDERIEIFGGPNWRTNSTLKTIFAEMDKLESKYLCAQTTGTSKED
ncbi:hypothetical protein N7478_010483 [Penicillium angulare]|uniref:uncharacterized protein n=1 Tax=Penicillium angulare TaxID=116970 RepID=UPI00253F6DC1|nr:uncharacterized protein N7478_010483 [Penicillium angulare]KAJ5267675.1 hypothetical protein N7478_010483 [Penicillium angulare]